MKKSLVAAGLALGILAAGGSGYAVAKTNAAQSMHDSAQRYEITSVEGGDIFGEAVSSGVYLYNDGEFAAYNDIKVGSVVEVTFGEHEDDIRDVQVIK
ncbi:hypothetical protein ACE41F_26820 [Bacillus cereus]|uniref:hypothetical protein n=1 Tax=Bacillus cereus TaxID=1396 RepID=UPI0035C9AC8C